MEQTAQARVCAGLHQGPEACGPPFPPISNIDLPPNKESSKALKHLEMTDAQGGMRERDTARQVWIISRNKLCFIDSALSFGTVGHRYCLTSDHMIRNKIHSKILNPNSCKFHHWFEPCAMYLLWQFVIKVFGRTVETFFAPENKISSFAETSKLWFYFCATFCTKYISVD